MAEVIQGYWGKLGVKAEVRPVDWGAFILDLQARPQPKEIVGQASTGRYTSGPTSIRAFTQGYTTGTYALYYGDPQFQTMHQQLLAMLSEVDAKKRQDALAKFAKSVSDSYSAFQIGSVPAYSAIGPKADADLPNPTILITMYTEYFKHAK